MNNSRGVGWACIGLLLCTGVLMSCRGAAVRTSPQPTKEQVQQASDRFFKTMRQEQQEHTRSE